jgi:ATP-binding cassette, subfamily B, bacterial
MFARFWPYAKGNRGKLLAAGACSLIVSAGELVAIILFGEIAEKRLDGFRGLAGVWLAAAAVSAVAMFFAEYLSALASERFALRLRDDLFEHAQRQPPDFFDTRNTGDLIVRLTEDVATIEAVVASGALGVGTAAVSVAGFVAAAFVISWRLAIVTLTVAPVFWLASHGFSGKIQRASERERVLTGRLTDAIEEGLSNQALVQAFNCEDRMLHRLHAEGDSWLRGRMAEVRLSACYGPASYLVETLCVLTVVGIGAWELSRGTLTLGGMLSFAMLLAYVYPPLQGLAGYRLALSAATEPAARLAELLDTPPRVTDPAKRAIKTSTVGALAFESVSFAYPGSDRQVLDDLSFEVRPGQTLAITGPSGSGKSTIAKLLLRFYDPDAGRVLLDGVPIDGRELRELRRDLTLLQQENLLFSGTIRDNIGYGKSGSTPGEIIDAARAAGAHEFISELPDGYDTPVGQRGRLLSGGQRQRIAIARAIMRDAPVLVLDEPTAGLSPGDSGRLMELLSPVMAGRTVIVITHDMSVTALADDVVHLWTQTSREGVSSGS